MLGWNKFKPMLETSKQTKLKHTELGNINDRWFGRDYLFINIVWFNWEEQRNALK